VGMNKFRGFDADDGHTSGGQLRHGGLQQVMGTAHPGQQHAVESAGAPLGRKIFEVKICQGLAGGGERSRLIKKIAEVWSLNDLDGIYHGISCSLRLPLA